MAFDALAPTYDQTFTETPIGRWLRGRVHARLNSMFKPGDHVLELGCGTGEDALHLAAQGIRVTATDNSEKMLEIARAKNLHTPLATFEPLDMNTLPQDALPGPFKGVFSNFGALNCVTDLHALAGWLAVRVRPGDKLGFAVMSPYHAWGMVWYGSRLQFGTATRRIRGVIPFRPYNNAALEIPIFYPSPARLRRDFAPWFEQTHIEGLGLFLPPSEVFNVVEKRPRLKDILTGLDTRLAVRPVLARFADHYWVEFCRTQA